MTGRNMNSFSPQSNNEALDEASKWLVGGGILTLALAPLALPGVVLVAVLALAFLLLALPIAAIGGAAMLLYAVGRRVVRRVATDGLTPAGRSSERRETIPQAGG
jgi:hypothetical protein